MKIGIFGGTFSPFHNGHLAIAECAFNSLKLDKLIIVPSFKSYLKSNVEDPAHRLNMTKLGIQNHPDFEVSSIEIKRGGNSYSYETLEELKIIYPKDELFFIVGADSYLALKTWKYPEKVFSLSNIVVAKRSGSTDSELEECKKDYSIKYNANTFFLPFVKVDISSSSIRQKIKSGQDVSAYLPKEVLQYINENKLYHKDDKNDGNQWNIK